MKAVNIKADNCGKVNEFGRDKLFERIG